MDSTKRLLRLNQVVEQTGKADEMLSETKHAYMSPSLTEHLTTSLHQ